jgi:hypothetical protein
MKITRVVLLVLVPVAAWLTGCMSTGEVIAMVPLADGTKLQVPMSGRGPQPTQTDDAQVTAATFDLQAAEHTLTYHLGFKLRRPATVQHVQVADLAGDKPIVIVDDSAPKLTNDEWRSSVEPWPANDARLQWLYTVENSIRVYRFTIDLADGRHVVLDQAQIVPAFGKEQIRRQLGANY